jgi:hypothetical protein
LSLDLLYCASANHFTGGHYDYAIGLWARRSRRKGNSRMMPVSSWTVTKQPSGARVPMYVFMRGASWRVAPHPNREGMKGKRRECQGREGYRYKKCGVMLLGLTPAMAE